MKLHFHTYPNRTDHLFDRQTRSAQEAQDTDHAAIADSGTPITDEHLKTLLPEIPNRPASPFTYPRPSAERSDYVGFKRFHIVSQHSADTEHGQLSKEYAYGDLSDTDDINAFLAQLDRLSPEQRNKLEHIKPSKSLLSIAERLDDEALSQLADILIDAGSTPIFSEQRRNQVPDQLVDALAALSDDVLGDTIATLASLREQGASYQAPTSPVSLDEHGQEHLLMASYDREKFWKHKINQPVEEIELLHTFSDLLISGKFKGDDLSTLNTHLQQSTFEQSRGILDMATVIKPFEKHSMLEMLDEADKDSEPNIFAYLSQQVDLSAHRQYYQSENNDMVVQQDLPPSDSDRGRLYSDILTAYDEYGLGWINDALEHVADTPPQIQRQLWSQLLDDAAQFEDQFIRSDALESWANQAITPILHAFHDQQIERIREFNSEREVPDYLGNLTYFGSMRQATISATDTTESIQSRAVNNNHSGEE